MAILALTNNPHKAQEYADHFALYGIKDSLEIAPWPMDMSDIKAWLKEHPGANTFAFREEADLYNHGGCIPLPRPYRVAEYSDVAVANQSAAMVYVLDQGEKPRITSYFSAIPGRIVDPTKVREPACFDWDDVFAPDQSSETYQEAKSSRGKVSARSLVLDDIITHHLSFRSNRAFKYGKLNENKLVDLNHWPLGFSQPVQFNILPIDFLRSNPSLQVPQIANSIVGNMFENALADGAHFRTAGNRREWLYWAPGINAGIPLTPKEDPAAELIYLAHDFAHYAMPDIIIDTPKDKLSDMTIIAHRMIGEVMSMVTADMFVMDGFSRAGITADSKKHGIHQVFAAAELDNLDEKSAFEVMMNATVEALLLGKFDALECLMSKSPESDTLIDRFMKKYSKFALADYEWTHLNLQEVHRHQGRQDAWTSMLLPETLSNLGLQTSSQLVARIAPKLPEGATFKQVLYAVLGDVQENEIFPKMEEPKRVSRKEILSRTFRRYFVGQLAFYARYPDMRHVGKAYLPMVGAASSPISLEEAEHLRQLFNSDLDTAQDMNLITPIDEHVYQSVFPIVRPHYVSYANPNFSTYREIFNLISQE